MVRNCSLIISSGELEENKAMDSKFFQEPPISLRYISEPITRILHVFLVGVSSYVQDNCIQVCLMKGLA